MIIYNPHNKNITKERIKQAEGILNKIPAKNCFITGSFLYKDKYKDIDVFIITRSKKKIKIKDKKIKISLIDFNEIYSLFYHSISKSCISKNILPSKPVKATISDYWGVVNEGVPTLLNQKNKYHKDVRFLVLYIEYFKSGNILDSFQLDQRIKKFKNYKEILEYVKKEVPKSIKTKIKKSYAKRFFYSQAGFYKELTGYKAQKFLYDLTHKTVQYG